MYVGTTSMAAIIKDSNYFKKFLLRRIEMITEKRSQTKSWITIPASLFVFLVSVAAAIGSEKLVRGNRTINPGTVKVDKEIQKITDEALTRALLRMKATAGFIIVTEPSTGRVLAVANKDLKSKRKGHWILNELMELGSIAKPIMVAEAFELGKTDLTSKHNCENGKYAYNGTTYSDWKDGGWPSLSTSETIELSSNICSIKIAQLVGEDKLASMFEKFGFGEGGTARNFPEALSGERLNDGGQLLPQAAVGLGFKSSALEILQAYGAIANGGKLMEPVSPTEKPRVLRQVLSQKSITQLHKLLQNAVLNGTGKRAQSDLYTTAGKTSTVLNKEFAGVSGYRSKEMANQAGFIGFAPAQNPAIEVYVGIINPNTDDTGAHGGYHAAPVFKEVVENVLTHMKVVPDKI
jgi:cell division protein FtsI (penicillin-binding protein 3)